MSLSESTDKWPVGLHVVHYAVIYHSPTSSVVECVFKLLVYKCNDIDRVRHIISKQLNLRRVCLKCMSNVAHYFMQCRSI